MRHLPVHCLSVYWLILATAAALFPADHVRAAEASRRPNILFFLLDDQPQVGLGASGNPHIKTPHMDQLAAEGMLFTNSFATTAICCSNRACILTGQHMRRHGIEDFQKPLSAEAFSETYPVLLRKAGYRTGYLGKFAVGWPRPEIKHLSLPADQFDFWYGFDQMIDFRQMVDGQPRYLTTLMTEKAREFLRTNPPDQPFCLTVAIKEPHGPWNFFDPDQPNIYEGVTIPPPGNMTPEAFQALPDFIRDSLSGAMNRRWTEKPETYQEWMRTFYRLVTRADTAIGEIMAALRESGLDENTVVICTSDNGEMQGAHGLTGKWLMYEESIRVPLIIRDGRLPAELRGRRCDQMALGIDLAPTMLALAGVAIPERMQGNDLGPLVRGEPVEWRSDWYYEHTYAHPPQHKIPRCEGVRTSDWKYVRYTDFNPAREQLFNLAADPHEEKDLAGDPSAGDMLVRLRQRCSEYRETLR